MMQCSAKSGMALEMGIQCKNLVCAANFGIMQNKRVV